VRTRHALARQESFMAVAFPLPKTIEKIEARHADDSAAVARKFFTSESR